MTGLFVDPAFLSRTRRSLNAPEVSAEQVGRLQEILRHVQQLPNNARPVQLLNGWRPINRRGH